MWWRPILCNAGNKCWPLVGKCCSGAVLRNLLKRQLTICSTLPQFLGGPYETDIRKLMKACRHQPCSSSPVGISFSLRFWGNFQSVSVDFWEWDWDSSFCGFSCVKNNNELKCYFEELYPKNLLSWGLTPGWPYWMRWRCTVRTLQWHVPYLRCTLELKSEHQLNVFPGHIFFQSWCCAVWI